MRTECERLDKCRDEGGSVGASGECLACAAEAGVACRRGSHGSPELDADAMKLVALDQDPGPTLGDIMNMDETQNERQNATD
jgi:hypothetical protein